VLHLTDWSALLDSESTKVPPPTTRIRSSPYCLPELERAKHLCDQVPSWTPAGGTNPYNQWSADTMPRFLVDDNFRNALKRPISLLFKTDGAGEGPIFWGTVEWKKDRKPIDFLRYSLRAMFESMSIFNIHLVGIKTATRKNTSFDAHKPENSQLLIMLLLLTEHPPIYDRGKLYPPRGRGETGENSDRQRGEIGRRLWREHSSFIMPKNYGSCRMKIVN